MPPKSTAEPLPVAGGDDEILFVNGFPRSGTTLMTTALTEALGGVTTTVGSLARHIPELARYLDRPVRPDRGVDRLQVTASTVEEYGYLLLARTGRRECYGTSSGVEVLRGHVAELALSDPGAPIVLKNPQDLGSEARLLRDFPTARIVLLRRRLVDIEASAMRAMTRTAHQPGGYAEAISGVRALRTANRLRSPARRALLRVAVRWYLYRGVVRLIRTAGRLPADRVAYLDHAELGTDPGQAATWAAHLLDPAALAESYRRHAFVEQSPSARSGPVPALLDALWGRAWRVARSRQAPLS